MATDTVRGSEIATAAAQKTDRIPALDFTKGALVLFMVLYHWQTRFNGLQGDIFRYLRFLTPSFIFITGFLISNVYLSKYRIADPRVPRRLLHRGLKILGLFILLNLAISLLFPNNGRIYFETLSATSIVAIYVTGSTLIPGIGKAAAFQVLVPISYLLILSAGLLIVSRRYKYTFHVVCIFLFLCLIVLDLYGFGSANLELLAMGLMGVVLGYVPMKTVDRFVKHPYALIFAYACYVTAITVWNVIYPLQVVGVCLTLMLLYLLGTAGDEHGRIWSHIILLGKYSLFGYIVQIAIIQFLYRGMRPFDLGRGALALSLFAAFALTMVSVAMVDYARGKATTVDRLYRVVFA